MGLSVVYSCVGSGIASIFTLAWYLLGMNLITNS